MFTWINLISFQFPPQSLTCVNEGSGELYNRFTPNTWALLIVAVATGVVVILGLGIFSRVFGILAHYYDKIFHWEEYEARQKQKRYNREKQRRRLKKQLSKMPPGTNPDEAEREIAARDKRKAEYKARLAAQQQEAAVVETTAGEGPHGHRRASLLHHNAHELSQIFTERLKGAFLGIGVYLRDLLCIDVEYFSLGLSSLLLQYEINLRSSTFLTILVGTKKARRFVMDTYFLKLPLFLVVPFCKTAFKGLNKWGLLVISGKYDPELMMTPHTNTNRPEGRFKFVFPVSIYFKSSNLAIQNPFPFQHLCGHII